MGSCCQRFHQLPRDTTVVHNVTDDDINKKIRKKRNETNMTLTNQQQRQQTTRPRRAQAGAAGRGQGRGRGRGRGQADSEFAEAFGWVRATNPVPPLPPVGPPVHVDPPAHARAIEAALSPQRQQIQQQSQPPPLNNPPLPPPPLLPSPPASPPHPPPLKNNAPLPPPPPPLEGRTMPRQRAHKPDDYRKYKSTLLQFMRYSNSIAYPNEYEFSVEELVRITPDDIYNWMCYKIYGTEDPDPNESPILGSSNSLLSWKKHISYFMINNLMQWNEISKIGNPTKATLINDLIRAVKKKETRGSGKKSNADRPFEYGEVVQVLNILQSSDGFDRRSRWYRKPTHRTYP